MWSVHPFSRTMFTLGPMRAREHMWNDVRAHVEKDEADIGEGVWLMLNDFKGVKPNPRFWGNMKRLIG